MRIITLDFETYWNSKEKYSLAKMGPIEYIRDPRFYVQCMGFRIDHGQTFVVPAGHISKTLYALRLDKPGTVVVGHNINGFDALVLSEHYSIRPYMILDTISMMNWLGLSRVMSCSHKTLTAALGHGVKQAGTVVSDGKKHISDFAPEDWKFFMRYCADDVIQCSENFFTMLPMVTNSDALRLMSITAKMATEPVFVPDEAMLAEYVKKLDADTEAKRNELSHIFNFENSEAMLKAIRSRSQFPKLLESLGCPCPMKWSEKQQKNIPAISKTDLEFTALLEHSDERVVALVRARLEQNSSIQKSRASNLLTFSGKPIPIMLGVYKAHTGRYTAGNEGTSDGLNFQNLSKRDPSKLAIRESIKAPAGYKVVACDSSQIEARILAWVAGQEDLVEQFRDGRDPYAEMASKIFGQTAQEIHDGAKRGDHPQHDLLKRERNVGKTCILSCLGADTEVLTDTGWKPIIKVSSTDKLWDGEQWVNHTGLSYNGMKKTIELDGLRLTADHLIWNGTTWNVAKDYLKEPSYIVSAVKYATESLETLGLSNTMDQKQLNFCSNVSNAKMNCGLKNTILTDLIPNIVNTVTRMWQQVLGLSTLFIQTHSQVISSESLLLSDVNADRVLLGHRHTAQNVMHWCSATADQSHIGCCSLTCAQENLQDVMHVLRKSPQTHTQKSTQDMQTSVLTQNYVDDCLIGSQVSFNDAIHQHAEYIQAMGVEVSNVCSVQDESSWNIYSRWMGMIIRNYLLIESIMMETMKKVICGLPQLMNSLKTDALYSNYKHVFDCLKQSLTNTRVEPVYDLLNAGPNHRFTVRTKHGAMIVHNCGYGVSAQKFSDTLLRSNVQLDDNLEQHAAIAAHAHAVYRQASFGITSFWKQCDRVVRMLASTDKIGELGTFGAHNEFIAGRAFIPGTQTNCAYLQLPNGYRLWYPNLRMYETQVIYDRIVHGKPTVTRIYGAGAVENLCQSYAFMMLGWQACRMQERGINLKANIHDAWITVVPEDKAEETKRIMEECMSAVPDWLAGFPVGCEAEIGDDFRIA